MFRFNFYWMYGVIFMILVALYMTNDSSMSKEIGWTEFQKLTKENVFEKMVVFNHKNVVEATVKSDKVNIVFPDEKNRNTLSPKVFIKIPSSDKFADFYDDAVSNSHIDTQVSFEEGDDTFGTFSSHSVRSSSSSLSGFSSCGGCPEAVAAGRATYSA